MDTLNHYHKWKVSSMCWNVKRLIEMNAIIKNKAVGLHT